MYTITIFILLAISIILLILLKEKLNFYKLIWILPFMCAMSWTQFIYFNNNDIIKAWEFSPQHILGIEFLGTQLEDYLFTIVISIILFIVHQLMSRRINTESSIVLKGINLQFFIALTFFFYLFGDDFGKHQVYYMALGLGCILLCFRNWDLKEFWVIFIVNFLIAGGWDIWGNNSTPQQWYYMDIITLKHNNCFHFDDSWWIKIGKGYFPLSIFPQYYISGALFFQGTIMITNKFFKGDKYGNRFRS